MPIPTIEEAIEKYETPAFSGSDSKIKLGAQLQAASANEISSKLEELTIQLAENADSSNKLSKRVYWLNIVLTLATVALAVSAFFPKNTPY